VIVHVVPSARSAQLLDAEKDGERKQGKSGELFGALAIGLVQARAKPEAELGRRGTLASR
jgi:hypothetical protein